MSEGESAKADEERKAGGSRIIGRVLPAAVRLWLRSQLENVGDLNIQLDGRDREIISGRLPKVAVTATNAVYQGIFLGTVNLSAEDIRINIGQVVRGKPLRLLQAFPVMGEVALSAQDLSASMRSPLLLEGLTDFWRGLARSPQLAEEIRNRYGPLSLDPNVTLHDATVALADQCVGMSFYPRSQGETTKIPVVIGAKLSVVSGHILLILSAKWLTELSELADPTQGVAIQSLEGFQWDLGKDTQISQLAIHPEQLQCTGQLQVNP
ncbi:MAG: hypothetical protein DCF25_07425 [Leptolyngbya foveolarum]|uniref:DUF2993 domain-containing protein n=1 Tax=Leptolyngbya foveolarum TaxID=47253 RepID=A0A2W4UFD8_9CYAN|nr:MAG: hypothetical protein DCF25_07425 [Leptolyngbya foveolarum]